MIFESETKKADFLVLISNISMSLIEDSKLNLANRLTRIVELTNQEFVDKFAGIIDDFVHAEHDVVTFYKLITSYSAFVESFGCYKTNCPATFEEAKALFGWEEVDEEHYNVIKESEV